MVADSVYCFQVVERSVLAFEQVANLDDVLVERTAANVGMNAPNGVDKILSRDDRVRILMKV